MNSSREKETWEKDLQFKKRTIKKLNHHYGPSIILLRMMNIKQLLKLKMFKALIKLMVP
jgi:hypothetical protein